MKYGAPPRSSPVAVSFTGIGAASMVATVSMPIHAYFLTNAIIEGSLKPHSGNVNFDKPGKISIPAA
jgi:hypothetical protein